MVNKIDDEKLKNAKAQLACHIEPPKAGVQTAQTAEKVRLTEMTTAGG